MDMFEKAEKLKVRANVSFEEAKAALDNCGGDLLDAMVYLEKQGKAKEPAQSTYSTSYEQQEKFTSVKEKVNCQQQTAGVFEAIRSFIRGFVDKCRGNYLYVKKDDEVKFKVPVLLFVIALIAFWKIILPVMVVLLFFGCHYSFKGKDELKEANEIMNKVTDLANQVKDGFSKDHNQAKDDLSNEQ